MNEEEINNLHKLQQKVSELKQIINNILSAQTPENGEKITETTEAMQDEKDVKLNIDDFVRRLGCKKEELENVYDLEGTPFTIITSKAIGNNSQQIISSTYLVLLGYAYLFKQKKVLSSLVKDILMKSDLKIDANFITYLRKEKGNIKQFGRRGSHNFGLYLTRPGETKAISIFKEIQQAAKG